jgi:hypothetical protein
MTHTKRSYQNPNYRGRGKWWFGWIHEIGKPWKELSNKILTFDKKERTKRLMSKRRRWQNKMEIEQIKKFCLSREGECYSSLFSEDPLACLVPIWDDYQNSLYPSLDDDDYYFD